MAKIINLSLSLTGAAFYILVLPTFTMAQMTKPSITMQGPAEPGKGANLRDALGRPCLDVEAAARAQMINPSMLDHVVSIKNNCPRMIKAKVCYFNSDHCNDLVIQGYKRVDTILGSMKGVTFFRYQISQQ